MSDTKYWFNDLNELINFQKLKYFLPQNDMSYEDKTNALVRLSIYIGILLSIIKKNYLFLYIPIITMIVSYILYLTRKIDVESREKLRKKGIDYNSKDDQVGSVESTNNQVVKTTEGFTNCETCVSASESNPFMNPLPFDDRLRNEACSGVNPVNKMMIEQYFNKGLYRPVNDIFNKSNSQREFYTVPSTTFPNNQADFANWLYKTPGTCKEGNGNQCVANNMDRMNGESRLPAFLY